jgi:hypothetical protein
MSYQAGRRVVSLPATTVIRPADSGALLQGRWPKRCDDRHHAATIRSRRRAAAVRAAERSARRTGARERRDAPQRHG